MRRSAHIGVLVLLQLSLLGTLAPTSAATSTSGAVVFNGVMTTSDHGIASPGVGSNTGDVDPTKTPPNFSNSASVHFASSTCLGALVNVDDSTKTLTEAGFCFFVADGFVHGYCEAMEGQVYGTLVVSVFNAGIQSFPIDFSFTASRGYLVLEGHWHKAGTARSGRLSGVIKFNPDPTAGSCLNKGAKTFYTDGRAVLETETSTVTTSVPQTSLL